MNLHKRRKGIIIFIIIAIIVFLGIGYFLFFPNSLSKNKELSDTVGNQKLVSDNNILQTACKNALNDYPQWTKAETDIIFWENPDKSFSFRNSPEDSSTVLSSPIPPTETLVDMDFIGLDEINYVTIGDNFWKIGLLKIDPYTKSLISEKNETFSLINISPVNKNEFIVFSSNGNKATLRYLNISDSDEKILLNASVKNTDSLKLAVSPKGTNFYLLYDGVLKVFQVFSKKQSDEINSVESAVWIGNDYILYSGPKGAFIYNISSKEKVKVEKIDFVLNLTFNPKDGGIIGYDENGNTKIIGCQKWNIVNSKQGAEFKTLTSEKTAITKKGKDYGYWRFKDKDWGVKILENDSKYVTIWQRY